MPLVAVFHVKDERFSDALAGRAVPRSEYRRVAVVMVDDYRDAYRVTNHVRGAWQENPEVRWAADGPQRSTSVGDVVVMAGGAYRVAPVGWVPMAW